MAETRGMVIALLVCAILITTGSAFILGFLGLNGVAVPAGANYANKYLFNQINQSLSSNSLSSAVGIEGSSLQLPSIASGFIGNFYVFGGIIIALVSYVTSIPSSLYTVITIASNPAIQDATSGIVTIVILSLAAIVVSIALTMLVFEILSAVMKYRV